MGIAYYEESFTTWPATDPSGWTTKDLSAYLPTYDDITAEIVIANSNTAVGSYSVGVRTNGSTLDRRFNLVPALSNGGANCATMHVQVTSGAIEYYGPSGVDFYLVGFWAGPKYVELDTRLSPSGTNSWLTMNLSDGGVPSGALTEIMCAQGWGGLLMGNRSIGNTIDRRIRMEIGSDSFERYNTWTSFVQSSGYNAAIEHYVQTYILNNKFYILGYWEVPPGDFTDVFQLDEGNPTSNNTWEGVDISGIPSGAVCSFVMTNSDISTSRVLGIRESGTSLERKIDIRFANNATYKLACCMHVISNSPIEAFSEAATGVNDDFTLAGYWDNFATVPLQTTVFDNADLFIEGMSIGISQQVDLYMDGLGSSSGIVNLFTISHDTNNDNINAYVSGSVPAVSSNMNMFVSGLGLFSDTLNLFVNGDIIRANNIDLYLDGFSSSSGLTNIFIEGSETLNDSLSMYVSGSVNMSSGDLNLYLCGGSFAFASENLFISGPFSTSVSGTCDLIVNGIVPIPGVSCPILDSTASIQIKSSLIQIYQSRIDALINQLGKNVYLEFDPIIEPCPNCEFDTIRHRSKGIYIVGGPVPFERGRRCPYCKGNGLLETPVNKCIKCLLKWNPRDAENHGISLSQGKGIVRLKTYLTNADDLSRARTALVNHDIVDQMKLKVKLLEGPIPVGLREDRYCISFWELL